MGDVVGGEPRRDLFLIGRLVSDIRIPTYVDVSDLVSTKKWKEGNIMRDYVHTQLPEE